MSFIRVKNGLAGSSKAYNGSTAGSPPPGAATRCRRVKICPVEQGTSRPETTDRVTTCRRVRPVAGSHSHFQEPHFNHRRLPTEHAASMQTSGELRARDRRTPRRRCSGSPWSPSYGAVIGGTRLTSAAERSLHRASGTVYRLARHNCTARHEAAAIDTTFAAQREGRWRRHRRLKKWC